jgi:hypothetical protein
MNQCKYLRCGTNKTNCPKKRNDMTKTRLTKFCFGSTCNSDFQSERDKVLDDLIQNVSERIKELKEMRAKDVYDDCAILALVGENQVMWAQLKELRQAGEP